MEHEWRWSVPANMLLAGEYAITEEGGCGIGLAVTPRAHATLTTSIDPLVLFEVVRHALRDQRERIDQIVRVSTVTSSGTHQLTTVKDSPIVAHAFDMVAAAVSNTPLLSKRSGEVNDQPVCHLTIDTSSFFEAASGRKLGLGSSAAAGVLSTAAALQLCGIDPVSNVSQTVEIAIAAHRAAHSGRGSGYDVATSAIGGIVHFQGGTPPRYHRSALTSLFREYDLRIYGHEGDRAVNSSRAVACFDHYISPQSPARAQFLRTNNTITARLEQAHSWREFFLAFSEAANLGIAIGERIGVSARIGVTSAHIDDGWCLKASGAGNERACVVALPSPKRAIPRAAHPMALDFRGLQSEDGTHDGLPSHAPTAQPCVLDGAPKTAYHRVQR